MAKRTASNALNIRLTDADSAAWERIKLRHAGSPSKAFRAMLAAEAGRNDIDLPAALRRAADELERAERTKSVDKPPPAPWGAAAAPLTPADLERLATVATTPPTPEPRQIGEARAASRFAKRANQQPK